MHLNFIIDTKTYVILYTIIKLLSRDGHDTTTDRVRNNKNIVDM